MRRFVFAVLLVCAVLIAPLTGALSVSAQSSTPAPSEGATAPITDPRVDPTATLDDAFFVSVVDDPVVPPTSGSTDLQPGEYKLLPSDVAVTEFYAEFYFDTPVIPQGGQFNVGFCFWVDVDGSCYDLYLQTDAAGNTFAGLGFSPATGEYVSIMQTGLLADEAIDPAPGAENSIDIVVYDGYAIIEGNSLQPLAVLALPDGALAGKVKAQIGFVDAGLPAGTGALPVTISEFAVWDLSAGVTPVFDIDTGEPSPAATPESASSDGSLPRKPLGQSSETAPMQPTPAA